jgi:hypothetical protein
MGHGSISRTKKRTASANSSLPSDSSRYLFRELAARGKLSIIIALVLIYGAGFFVRFEDFPRLRNHPDIFLFQNQPILANGDGYYYLRLARDLSEGNYESVDSQRRYPDNPPRPSPPPLLSVITSMLHSVLGISLEWIAIFLPVLLAPLLILPLYALARPLGGGWILGLSAALIAVVCEYYTGRTRLGVYDTDCMIVTLTVSICYALIRFARDTSVRRYAFFAAAVLGFALFLWWWDTAIEAVSAICLAMFAVALACFYRPSRKEGMFFFGSLAALLLAVLAWIGFETPLMLARKVSDQLAFLSGGESGPFPPTAGNIRELQVVGLKQTALYTAGNGFLYILAAIGYVWLLIDRKKEALLLAVLTLLALLPIRFGNRFLIFQVPVIALGIGYLAESLARRRGVWRPLGAVALLLVAVSAFLGFRHSTARFYRSPMASSMNAIQAVIDKTPKDAVLWTSFWHGYPVLYYSGRAVITDGGSLDGPRLMYQNLPLACADARTAANFMQFWVGSGTDGMNRLYRAMNDDHCGAMLLLKEVCAAGPEAAGKIITEALTGGVLHTSAEHHSVETWLNFFFPAPRRPIYLLLTQDMTRSMVWFERGTWDLCSSTGARVHYRPHTGVKMAGGNLRGKDGLFIDMTAGTVAQMEADAAGGATPLVHVLTHTGLKLERSEFGHDRGLCFEWIPTLEFGAVMSPVVAKSLFNSLFIRHTGDPRYFRRVYSNTPSFHIWQVRGDRLKQQ